MTNSSCAALELCLLVTTPCVFIFNVAAIIQHAPLSPSKRKVNVTKGNIQTGELQHFDDGKTFDGAG